MNASEMKILYHRLRVGRAKNHCEHCGESQNNYVVDGKDITRIKLTVFHLDLNTSNFEESNLAVLCQDCEAKAESAEQARQDRARGSAIQRQLL